MVSINLEHSSRFLPNRINTIALEQPSKPFICLPRDDDVSGFEDMTYKQFANAINGASHFLDDKLEKCEINAFDTIAYIGENDLRYLILVVAAVKTGRKVSHYTINVEDVLIFATMKASVSIDMDLSRRQEEPLLTNKHQSAASLHRSTDSRSPRRARSSESRSHSH